MLKRRCIQFGHFVVVAFAVDIIFVASVDAVTCSNYR